MSNTKGTTEIIFFWGPCSWLGDGCLLPASSHDLPSVHVCVLISPSYTDTSHIRSWPHFNLVTPSRTLFPNTITFCWYWRLGHQHMNWGRRERIHPIANSTPILGSENMYCEYDPYSPSHPIFNRSLSFWLERRAVENFPVIFPRFLSHGSHSRLSPKSPPQRGLLWLQKLLLLCTLPWTTLPSLLWSRHLPLSEMALFLSLFTFQSSRSLITVYSCKIIVQHPAKNPAHSWDQNMFVK